jgi:hypothetical protein
MASIINASINLNEIPKDKIISGAKGKYLPITIVLNDDFDKFGNQGPITVGQSKEERESKAPKVYLGNVKVLWTNGENVNVAPKDGQQQSAAPKKSAPAASVPAFDDLPF